MSNKTLFDYFKRTAKVHAKEQGIKLHKAQENLARNLGFNNYHEVTELARKDPNDKRFYL